MNRDAPSSAFQLQTLPDDEAIAAAVSTTLPTFGVKVLKHLQLLALRRLTAKRLPVISQEQSGVVVLPLKPSGERHYRDPICGRDLWQLSSMKRILLCSGEFEDLDSTWARASLHVMRICRGEVSFDCTDGHDNNPFCIWCGLVNELRPLLDVSCLALTATASTDTRSILNQTLGIRNAVQTVKSPDRPNMLKCIKKVHPDSETTFCWKLKMLLHFIHSLSEFLGGNTFFPEGENRMENRLIEMFHSTTPETNKELILESLSDTNKKCQVVLATNALGMGIDAKGLYTCSSPQWSLQLFGSLYARDRAMWSRWDSESGSFVLPYRQQLAHIDSNSLPDLSEAKAKDVFGIIDLVLNYEQFDSAGYISSKALL
ncbi:uncharacterized protein LOC134191539 [Corticium candelabrum]|uniref:uncharacterized protein LOC134191539 n=1 Tax=Corticium candelabrum TaxID=121492 RepID=UPI002E25A05E|nr:uncharacterized protein LOC134191539 [Corticium candelabrum]